MNLTPHFTLAEFACHDGTAVPPDLHAGCRRLCVALEELRAYLGAPITIMSGYRSPAYNAKCGGAKASRHLYADGADVQVAGVDPATVAGAIEHLVATGKIPAGGVGVYAGWVHYDVRKGKARWDNRADPKKRG